MRKNPVLKLAVILLLPFVFFSCAQMSEILEKAVGQQGPLTTGEVAMGLKEALTIGTRLAVNGLSAEDGFLLDEAVKILLPPEAEKAVNLIRKIPAGRKLTDDLVLRLNRAAEFAVTKAVPIFVDAITSLTIRDAFDILRGDDYAATRYLRNKTFDHLYNLFLPEVEKSLGKKLIGNISTARSWELFSGKYNQAASSIAGKIAGIQPLNTDLNDYVTGKALEALFLKLQDEERKIRRNPLARTTDLLRKVFGSV